MNCQRFTITNVAFSASWTHKHDGDYASVLQHNICGCWGGGELAKVF